MEKLNRYTQVREKEQHQWNLSYKRGGNICFYPHEEIVRFINKYVRKRDGINHYYNIMDLKEKEWNSFASLDVGCGVGRHVRFLEDFGLNPVGIDLSDRAIAMGKEWFSSLGRNDLKEKLMVGSVDELPFEDNSFWICVSHGTLDSMPRETAEKGFKEILRVIKPNGLIYLDLIMDLKGGDKEEIVNFGYEKGTVQSYFTIDGIKKLIGSQVEAVDFKIITWADREEIETNRRAHIVLKNRKSV